MWPRVPSYDPAGDKGRKRWWALMVRSENIMVMLIDGALYVARLGEFLALQVVW